MAINTKLDKIFEEAKRLPINSDSKIVMMSDCHRGSGDEEDNFIKNQNIFEVALTHYYHQGFTYIELGDGDEMWEVKNYQDIIEEHLSTFYLLKKFHENDRLIMIYGNHDLCKKSNKIRKKYFYRHYHRLKKEEEDLLNHLTVHEALVLTYQNFELFLLHGHQVDLLNSTFWRLSRFLVRHVWRNLEKIGIKDPTSAAKNYKVSNKVERKLKNWSVTRNKLLIAGHTHRPIYPKIGQSLYFNDGSCIHPNGITCLEIEKGKITLVKWKYKVQEKNLLTVGREVIEGEEYLDQFFKKE